MFSLPSFLLYHENCSINLYLYVSAYYAQAARLHYGLSLSDNGFEVCLNKDADVSLCNFLNEFHV